MPPTEYIAAEELKQTLELHNQTFADQDIDMAIRAASRGVENLCGRRFWLDDTANSRWYSPEDPCELAIDDLVELTSVEVDQDGDGDFEETWVQGTDFVLEPLNAQADGRPWTTLRVHPNAGRDLPCGLPRSVQVTGQFGWPAVPDEVREATVILASKLLRRAREAPFGVVAVGLDMGGALRIARSDPDVMFLVGPFIRTRIAVA